MSKQTELSFKKSDLLLIIGISVVSVAILVVFILLPRGGDRVDITVDGEHFAVFSLSEDREININGHNVLVIEDGSAYMKSADCPDRLCLDQARIDGRGGSIICLPNRVVVEVSDGSIDIDAVAEG